MYLFDCYLVLVTQWSLSGMVSNRQRILFLLLYDSQTCPPCTYPQDFLSQLHHLTPYTDILCPCPESSLMSTHHPPILVLLKLTRSSLNSTRREREKEGEILRNILELEYKNWRLFRAGRNLRSPLKNKFGQQHMKTTNQQKRPLEDHSKQYIDVAPTCA